MGISDIFDIGRSGLNANQQALQTASHNMANAATPGYTRQRAVMESRPTSGAGGSVMGGGVDVKTVIRVHDEFVQRQMIEESKNLGSYQMRSDSLKHMERLLHANGFEIGEVVNNFFNAYREVSANPESSAVRSLVVDSARSAVENFRKTTDSLINMRRDLDLKMEGFVNEVNVRTKELASLNETIAHLDAIKAPTNELQDRRDVIVRELSKTLGYSIATNEQGHVNISATGLGILVEGNTVNLLSTKRTAEHGTKAAGNMDIFLRDGYGEHVVTRSFKDGELAGLIHVRDEVINPTLAHLDNVAFQFAKEVNDVHRQGVGMDGKSERDLFTGGEEVNGFAARIDLSEPVKTSFEAIATGIPGFAPGDNRIALRIADLQNTALIASDGIVREGSTPQLTINESLNALMGKVATTASQEEQLLKHQEQIMNQLENYRQSISGVSMEEEAMKMIQHQAVFAASAKTMKVGDELLQTILSLKDH